MAIRYDTIYITASEISNCEFCEVSWRLADAHKEYTLTKELRGSLNKGTLAHKKHIKKEKEKKRIKWYLEFAKFILVLLGLWVFSYLAYLLWR